MAVYQSVRQTQQTAGRSEGSFHRIIDKLHRCSEIGAVFYSRCSDGRVPAHHAKERLRYSYGLHLDFMGAIVDAFDRGPLASPSDERWKKIDHYEKECIQYLQESESFLFNILKDSEFPSDASSSQAREAVVPSPSVYVLPKKPARFYGREDALTRIHQTLEQHRSVTISGIAGVGKTSIALLYAYQSFSEYSIIVWMRSEPTTALDQGCHEALRRLGVIEEADKAGIETRQKWRDYLAQSASRWLIIFDNVEQADDLDQFWPSGGDGKVIITTRKPMIGYHATDDEIPISPFTEAEGRECILNLTSWAGGDQADPESATELSNELGGLPIGIAQMTALMRAQKTPIKSFLRGYRRNKLKYHDKEVVGVTSVYPNMKPKIGTNWTMSFNALGHQSKSLLGILAFLAPDAIPQDLFKHWDESASRRTRGLLQYCETVDDFLEVEGELMNFALVDKDPNTEMLSLHRLEQFQFVQFLDIPARQRAFEQASKLLCDVFPKEHTGQRFTGRWHDCERYIQHAVVLSSHYSEQDPALSTYSAPPEFAKLMAWCSWLVTKPLPEDFDKATWSLLNYNAGTVETSMGKFEKARESLNQALKVRRSLGNKDDISAALNNLGLLYNSIHEFDLAEKHYSEAPQIHLARADTPDRNLSLTMVKHNLQRNAIQSGKNMPSVDELKGTVAFFKSTISWWMTGHACLVLGNLLFKQGDYGAAEKSFAEARDTLSAPGRASKQPAVAMVIYKLGCVAYEQADYNKAAEYFRESILISKAYPAIPAEQARTQFMLAKALRMGAETIEENEESKVEQMVNNLMSAYHTSNGKLDFEPCSEASDFDVFITAKYQ